MLEDAIVRPVDRFFAAYSDDHRHPANQWLHVLCGAAVLMALSWGSVAALHAAFGATVLAVIGASVFVVAWVGQFIGHHIEGRRPSFFTDLVYLMIGPVWVLAKGYRKLSVGY